MWTINFLSKGLTGEIGAIGQIGPQGEWLVSYSSSLNWSILESILLLKVSKDLKGQKDSRVQGKQAYH